MKTNLSALMNLISEKEKQYNSISDSITNYIYNTTIQELNGKTNVIDNNKDEFQTLLIEIEKLSKDLSTLKGILYDRNNSLKLSDGRTIQQAIVENNNTRNLKFSLENLLNYRNAKRRITEVNNSYFEIREINYDPKELKEKVEFLNEKIQKTDFEISKLNSEEFTITL